MSKKRLSDEAYEFIKDKIIKCEYAPGSMINESMICEAIKSSRTPVREAIRILEQENLVKVIYKKGIIIKDVTLDDINLIYETRLLIEPYAMRCYGKQMDLSYFLMLDEKIQKAESYNELFVADDQLHNYIVSQTKNIYLINAINAINNHNMRIRILSGEKMKDRMEKTSMEHSNIIKHVIDANYEEAALALTYHLEKAKEACYKSMMSEYNFNLNFALNGH